MPAAVLQIGRAARGTARSTSPSTWSLSTADIATLDRWSTRETAALQGKCRARLLGHWARNLDARFGEGASANILAALEPDMASTATNDAKAAWIPVATQLRLSETIADLFFGGDLQALYPLVLDDLAATAGRSGRFALRRLGVKRAITMAPRAHRAVYSVGQLDSDIGRKEARLRFSGADLFDHPTWRMLQVFAVRAVFELLGEEPREIACAEHPGGFDINLVWS